MRVVTNFLTVEIVMKKSTVMLLLLVSCVPYQYSYQTRGMPEQGDNVIIIKDTEKKDLKRHLAVRGYTFDSEDDITFRTNEKSFSGTEIKVRLSAVIIENDIHIRTDFTTLSFSAAMSGSYAVTWISWEYHPQQGQSSLVAFGKFFPDLFAFSKDIEFIKN